MVIEFQDVCPHNDTDTCWDIKNIKVVKGHISVVSWWKIKRTSDKTLLTLTFCDLLVKPTNQAMFNVHTGKLIC